MKKILLITAILTLATSAFASPIGGEVSASGVLNPGESHDYRVVLRGGERWQLQGNGYGNGDLDCAVYDEDGGMVGSDTDSTNVCIIDGFPRWTGPFTVRVKNNGDYQIEFGVVVR